MLDRIRDWIRSPLRALPGLDILCDYPPEVIEKQKLRDERWSTTHSQDCSLLHILPSCEWGLELMPKAPDFNKTPLGHCTPVPPERHNVTTSLCLGGRP